MKSPQTTTIERLLTEGKHTMTQLACMFGISRSRVNQIDKAMNKLTRAEVRELYNVDQVISSVVAEHTHGWII